MNRTGQCPATDRSAGKESRPLCGWRRFAQRHSPRNHLYLQIYASFLIVLVVFSVLVAALFWSFAENRVRSVNDHLDVLIEKTLMADKSTAAVQETLDELAGTFGGPVAFFAPDGRQIASSGEISREARKQFGVRDPLHTTVFHDGRVVIFDWHSMHKHENAFIWLAIVALLAALGSFPLARRLTRRIEALKRQADALAQGNLSARAEVRGCDEIAELASGFNQAAERIETLVNGQRAMLASASHELRSPLARIRMACSLLGDQRPKLLAQIERDTAELDSLIGDLLLASRLSNDTPALRHEVVDLLGLAAEEANRAGASLSGEAVELKADGRLLRQALRNLLENSRRYASGSAVEIGISCTDKRVTLRVLDRGPGVPEAERERIFEPFYRPPGTAETGEGVGYGLALVRRVARLHGGEARCRAREGGGACFEIELPME
jgi:signal transduction histidine kinase